MFKNLDDEKAKINQSDTSNKIVDDDMMESIIYGLLSTKCSRVLEAVCQILTYVKKKRFQQFSRKDFYKYLVNILKRKGKDKIYNIVPILRCFYYYTDRDNRNRYDVWDIIEDQMNSILTDPKTYPHSFKIVCKIFSNYLIEANEKQLINFKSDYFDIFVQKFEENLQQIRSLEDGEELGDAFYFCQGCLRIFSAFCNQYNIFENIYPGFINECCIRHFFDESLYSNDYMKYVTIMYIYYITKRSPNAVIYSLCKQEFIERLYSFIYNSDKKKNYLSFYSILILLSIAKLHDGNISSILTKFSPFDVDPSNLPKSSQTPYLHFLYHIALTNQSLANDFIKSQFLKSIIDPNDDYLIGFKNIKKEKFMKYISIIYYQFPDFRESIINFFEDSNPFYFFVSFIVYNQENTDFIIIGIENLNDLLQKIQNDSDINHLLREKLIDRYDDISSSLQDILSIDDFEDVVNQKISNFINDINTIMITIQGNE